MAVTTVLESAGFSNYGRGNLTCSLGTKVPIGGSAVNIAFIFAGGTGQRVTNASRPKQFLDLHGKPVIVWTLEIFEHHPDIDAIVVVMLESWISRFEKMAQQYGISKLVSVVPGGADGQASIRNGVLEIERLYSSDDIVLVHDGVRPLVSAETISTCIACAQEHGNAITVVPMVETIVNCEKTPAGDLTVRGTVDRDTAFIARAPQCFKVGDLAGAHHQSLKDGLQSAFVDSASLMRHYGHTLYTIQGDPENIKITTPSDYYIASALLEANESRQAFGL